MTFGFFRFPNIQFLYFSRYRSGGISYTKPRSRRQKRFEILTLGIKIERILGFHPLGKIIKGRVQNLAPNHAFFNEMSTVTGGDHVAHFRIGQNQHRDNTKIIQTSSGTALMSHAFSPNLRMYKKVLDVRSICKQGMISKSSLLESLKTTFSRPFTRRNHKGMSTNSYAMPLCTNRTISKCRFGRDISILNNKSNLGKIGKFSLMLNLLNSVISTNLFTKLMCLKFKNNLTFFKANTLKPFVIIEIFIIKSMG